VGFAPVGDQQVALADNDKVEIVLKMRVAGVDEAVLVTAQKHGEERLLDVPISMSVVNGADLERSGLKSVTDAIQTVPGVATVVGMQGGGTQLAVRGVSAGAPLFSGSSPIAYYIDSVPFGLTTTAAVPDMDAYDLQRIEVLRGPQGTLYGASALGGLVRLLTNDPNLDQFEGKLRTTLSSTDGGGANYRGDVTFNVPLVKDRLGVRADLGYTGNSGWIDRPGQPDANTEILRNYRVKVKAKPTDSLTIGTSMWSARNHQGAPSVAADNGSTGAGTLPEPISTDFDAYGVTVEQKFSRARVTSNTSYLNYSNVGYLDLTVRGLPGRLITTRLKSNVFSEEATVTSTPGTSWSWSTGVFYRDARDDEFQVIPGLLDPTNDGLHSRSYAGFGQVGRRFLERFELDLGLRYFHDDVSYGEKLTAGPGIPLFSAGDAFHATTPRVGLNWYPSANLMAYASYSQGFRSGFPQEAQVARLAPEVPSVKPDTLVNYEVGAKGELLKGRLAFDTAVYHMHWRDVQQQLLVVDPATGLGSPAPVNGKSASGLGVDGEVTVRPTGRLELAANGSWNNLSLDEAIYVGDLLLYRKGDRVNFSYKLTGGGSATYFVPLPIGGLEGKFSVSANYKSQVRSLLLAAAGIKTTTIGDPFAYVRASAAITKRAGWTATVFVENLTNVNPRFPRSSPAVEWTSRTRPRTVGLQLDYGF